MRTEVAYELKKVFPPVAKYRFGSAAAGLRPAVNDGNQPWIDIAITAEHSAMH